MERLVCWMEENQQSLRGKQTVWYKDVKEQVFGDNEDITVKRVGEKVQNMKNAWRNARKLQEQSGGGVRAEDNAPTFNALLETKCPLFWRLDEIWGTRPNVTPVMVVDSAPPDSSDSPPINVPTSAADPDSGDEPLDWDDTPPPPKAAAAAIPSTSSKPAKSQIKNKVAMELKEIIGDRGLIELEKEDKRIQLERELHKERMAAEDRRFQQQLEMQERIVKIQAEAQAQQFQAFMHMMTMVSRPNQPENNASEQPPSGTPPANNS